MVNIIYQIQLWTKRCETEPPPGIIFHQSYNILAWIRSLNSLNRWVGLNLPSFWRHQVMSWPWKALKKFYHGISAKLETECFFIAWLPNRRRGQSQCHFGIENRLIHIFVDLMSWTDTMNQIIKWNEGMILKWFWQNIEFPIWTGVRCSIRIFFWRWYRWDNLLKYRQ